MEQLLFTNVVVLDCTGAEPFPGEVLIDGDRIKTVARAETPLPRDGVTVIGETPPEEQVLQTLRNAKLYLDHGFTSCISAGSVKPRLDLVIRNAINNGDIPGPRLLASSPWFTVTGGLGDIRLHHMDRHTLAIILDGPDEFRRAAREMIREGVDIIKLVVSGDTGMPHAGPTDTMISEPELAAVAEVVHAQRRRMSAHAKSAESIKRCVRNGVKLIYHATYADEEALDLIEAHKDRVYVSPNVGFPAVAVLEGAAWALTGEEVERMGFPHELEASCKVIPELHRRGVRILAGGDYGFASTPHGTNARDIEHFIKLYGFTPMEAIMSMTRWSGECMDLPDELGQIKEGFLANLLLVDGDPLAEPRILQDKDKLAAIMKNGEFHKQPVAA